jgi:hypothetical protein
LFTPELYLESQQILINKYNNELNDSYNYIKEYTDNYKLNFNNYEDKNFKRIMIVKYVSAGIGFFIAYFFVYIFNILDQGFNSY